MKIWRFAGPRNAGFAEVERRGGWTPSTESGSCPECGTSRHQRIKPLQLAWVPGSDRIGDFVWVGFGPEVVVTDDVFGKLASRFSGFEDGSVEFVDHKEPVAKGRQPLVELPYQGPPLHELWVTRWAELDPERSSIELQRHCGTCGTDLFEAYGIERWDSHFDPERRQLVRALVPRAPNGGLYLTQESLAGADIFRVLEFPGWTLCTDAVRDHVRSAGYTNVDFLEMGEVMVGQRNRRQSVS